MPIILKSLEEARKHQAESSKEVAATLGTITKSLSSKETNLGHTIGVVGKSLDDLHTQCLSAWSAMDKLEETSTLALSLIHI